MDERTVIIADKDLAYRSRITGFLRKAGYRVEATGSADQVLHYLQEKRAVLLLGSDFGSRTATAELVRLLKKCNRQLQIIMVSDQMSLAQARQVREEGIFYQALKPAGLEEAEELGQVVACAFEKQAANARLHPALAALQDHVVENARPHPLHALPWIVGLVALLIGTNYHSLSAVHAAQEGSNFAVWLFLGFCAFIVVGQMLPIFRIKLAKAERRTLQESTTRSGK